MTDDDSQIELRQRKQRQSRVDPKLTRFRQLLISGELVKGRGRRCFLRTVELHLQSSLDTQQVGQFSISGPESFKGASFPSGRRSSTRIDITQNSPSQKLLFISAHA